MSGAIVKQLILKRSEVVESVLVPLKQDWRVERLRTLQYHLLGQVGFWLILSFTGKSLCTVIPNKSSLSANKSSPSANKLTELGAIALQPPTDVIPRKFPIQRSKLLNVSGQAKDLAPIESSDLPELIPDAEPIRAAFMPQQAEALGTTSKAFPASVRSPVLAQSRCWKSIPSNCVYTATAVQVGQAPNSSTENSPDPELGDLQLSPLPEDELGTLRIQPIAADPPTGAEDPELGTLRLQERSTPQPPIVLPERPRPTSAYLLARADYFKSSNVFSDVDPVDDGLIRAGLTFFYAPPIGSKTFLITSLDANLIRYSRLGQYRDVNGDVRSLNYDELRLRAGIFHRITPRLSAEVGWSNQKLFTSSRGLQQVFGGQEFFGDNSIRVELSRQDTLSPRLSLNTYYQFRWSFANPDDRSRILNSAIATLGYSFSQRLQTAIDYQFTWSHFTQQARDDLYHQLVARVSYNITPRTQINLFSGFSFGHSTDRRIDFNSFIFGAGLVFNLPLF
ncbi:MAG TPA: hypothetical protein VL134_01250 [Leptolyngbya sp.]|nr:hypothetical protein [Leptolyngbya sp.]